MKDESAPKKSKIKILLIVIIAIIAIFIIDAVLPEDNSGVILCKISANDAHIDKDSKVNMKIFGTKATNDEQFEETHELLLNEEKEIKLEPWHYALSVDVSKFNTDDYDFTCSNPQIDVKKGDSTSVTLYIYHPTSTSKSTTEQNTQKNTEQQQAQNTPNHSTAIDYVVNISTKKFHLSSCSDAKRIKDSNKQVVHDTYDNLVAQGYSPCIKCI